MSWLRTAVNRAVEVGGKNNLTRTARYYADTVAHHAGQAVAGGARLLQDRVLRMNQLQAFKNFQGFRVTVKRLDEVSISCRGVERVQLLRRWLVALKEVERILEASLKEDVEKDPEQKQPADECRESPRKSMLVLYYDADMGREPMNFRDVFLYSQALEGITLSMILEAPDEEEVTLLLEIFRLCLTGENDSHTAILSSIQDLAKAFSAYEDEVLVKREELLQYAQAAIAGLKTHAELARIDAEASSIQKKLDQLKSSQQSPLEGHEKVSEETIVATVENLKEELVQVQLCSRLEEVLLRKKSINNGDTPKNHAQKIDKLKVLSESLASSTSKAEKRIWDQRSQKEEAISFRMTKAKEVSQVEKELAAEIEALERHKGKLEDELKKVNTSLATAVARFRNAREEREQFDVASDQIVAHLKMKEDELSKSVSIYKAEADVVNVWIKFLEETWDLQSKFTEHKEKQTKDELERYGKYFVNLAIHFLSVHKEELGSSVARIRKLAENLKSTEGSGTAVKSKTEDSSSSTERKNLEEEYLNSETKLATTLSVVDSMRKQFYTPSEGIYRKESERVKELFDAINEIKSEFESIERPALEIETPAQRSETPSKGTPRKDTPRTPKRSEDKPDDLLDSPILKVEVLTPTLKLAKLESASENVLRDAAEEINDWEFD